MRRAFGAAGQKELSQLIVPSTEAADGPSINSSRTGDSRTMVSGGPSGTQGCIRRIRRDKIVRRSQISPRPSPGNGCVTLSPTVTQVSQREPSGCRRAVSRSRVSGLVVCSATTVAPRLSATARGSSLVSSLLTDAPVYLSASRSQQPFGCGADSRATPWFVIIGVWCLHLSGRRFRSAGGRLWALLCRCVTRHAAVSAGTGHFERIASGVR